MLDVVDVDEVAEVVGVLVDVIVEPGKTLGRRGM
jgi:hypothetical protein